MEIRSQLFPSQPAGPLSAVKSTGGSAAPGAPETVGASSTSSALGAGQQAPQDVANLTLGQALSGDETRVSLVQALQEQIAGGTYRIDAPAVAAKLLSSLAEGA